MQSQEIKRPEAWEESLKSLKKINELIGYHQEINSEEIKKSKGVK